MRRRFALALIATLMASAFVATEAPAQRTGTRMGRNAVNGRRDANVLIMIVANCLAARRPELLRRWFDLLPGSPEEGALLDAQEGDFEVCLDDDQFILGGGRELTYSPRRLRVPAALALVRRSLSHAPGQSPLAPNSEPWFVAQLAALPSGSTIDRGSLLAQEFGHCVTVNHWPEARALLASREGSAPEQAAFAALSPYLGSCLPQGLQLAINPKSLREYIGEPFYHVLAASPALH